MKVRCNDCGRKFCCYHCNVLVKKNKRNNGPDLRWPKGFKPLKGEVCWEMVEFEKSQWIKAGRVKLA